MPQTVERRTAGLHDVAVGGVVVPVHRVVGAQVLPAVAGAEVSRGGRGEAGGGDERAARLGVVGEQRAVPRPAAVIQLVRGAVGQPRVVQGVQLVRLAGQRPEVDVHHHGGPARVGDVGLRDAPAAGLLGVDLLVDQRLRVGEPGDVGGRVALAFGEGLPVRHGELQVADARRAEVGIVDLRQRAVLQGVPHLAGGVLGRAVAVLVRGCPGRRLPGTARGALGQGTRGPRSDQQRGAGQHRASRAQRSRSDRPHIRTFHSPMSSVRECSPIMVGCQDRISLRCP